MIKIKKIVVVWMSALLFLSFSLHGIAKDRPNNDSLTKQKESKISQAEANEPKIVKELVERRKPNEKTHLLEDGSILLEIHLNDIHYVDLAGKLQDINTDLIDEIELADVPLKNYSIELKERFAAVKDKMKQKAGNKGLTNDEFSYTSLQTPFSVDIPKIFVKGYGIEQGGKRLKFIPVNSSKTAKAIRDTSQRNKVVYKNAWPHTDVELIVVNEGIKENIILNNASAPQSFSFEVQGNLDDFNVMPAWLEDSKGTTREVALTKRVVKDKTYVDLTWDSKGLQYPILIDPTVNGVLTKSANVNIGSSFTVGSDKMVVGGKKSAAGFTETYRSYMQFSTDRITQPISSAYLRVSRYGSNTQSTTSYVEFQPVMAYGNWVEPMNNSNKLGIVGGGGGNPVYRYNIHQGTTAYPYYDLNVGMYLSGITSGIVQLAVIAVNSDAQYNSNTSSETVIQLASPTLFINVSGPLPELPTTPLELKATNTTNSSITLSWQASSHSTGITSYQVIQNNAVIATTTSLQATIQNLTPGKHYQFTVRALAQNGSISKESSAIIYIIKAEATYIYTYSNAGKLLNVKITVGADQFEQKYVYDSNGNVIQIITSKLS